MNQEIEVHAFFMPWSRPGQVCFNADPSVCRLAEKYMVPASGYIPIALVVALIPTALNVLLSRLLTRPRAQKIVAAG